MRLISSSLRLRLLLFALFALLPTAGFLLFYRAGNHTFFANLVALLLIGVAVLAATWLGGTLLVIRPLRSLLAATLKVGQGDLTVRTGLGSASSELGRLATAFDNMAAHLEQRDREQQVARFATAKSEEDYRYLFAFNPAPMWVYDPATLQFLAVNDAALKTYGYSRPEFLSMTLRDIRRPEDVPALLKRIPELPPGAPAYTAWQHRIRDGTQIDVDIVSHSIGFGGRQARVVLVNNITERKRMEMAIKESEWQHRQLFENSPLPIGVYEEGTLRFLAVNDAAVRLYGYSRDEFTGGMIVLDVCPPEDHAFLRTKLTTAPPSPTRVMDWRHRRKDGSMLFAETTSHPIEFHGKRARIVLANDMTARKQAEDALRESEGYHRRLFETSPIGLVLCTLDMHFVDANPAFASIIGRTVEDVKRLAYAEISPRVPDPEEDRQQQRLRHTGHFGPYEKELIHADGHRVPVRLTGLVIERGGKRYIWSSVEDITETKRRNNRYSIWPITMR